MAEERDRAATVIRQTGERVEVEHKGERLTAAMKGFPPGFNLRPGARVILVDDATGLEARPLVRAITTPLAAGAVERRAELEVQGRRAEMQESTVLEERREEKRPGEEYEVWVVERAEQEASDQVIAVRRR